MRPSGRGMHRPQWPSCDGSETSAGSTRTPVTRDQGVRNEEAAAGSSMGANSQLRRLPTSFGADRGRLQQRPTIATSMDLRYVSAAPKTVFTYPRSSLYRTRSCQCHVCPHASEALTLRWPVGVGEVAS